MGESFLIGLGKHSVEGTLLILAFAFVIQAGYLRQLYKAVGLGKEQTDKDVVEIKESIQDVKNGVIWKDEFEQFEKRFERVEKVLNGSLRDV